MNCKPGDLAIMVNSLATNNGKIYRVLDFVGGMRIEERDGTTRSLYDCWRVECLCRTVGSKGKWYRPGEIAIASDAQLRPIRDPGDDAKDEMLRPLPHKEIA